MKIAGILRWAIRVIACLAHSSVMPPAHFFLPHFQGVPYALALGVDLLRDFLQVRHQLFAHIIQGSLGAGDRVGH